MATTDTTFTDDEEEIIIKSVPTIFSWGRGDMGALLRMKDDEKSFDGVYVYSNASRIILQISSNEYHTACITSTGDVLLCGSNEEGQVSIDYTENEVKKPRLLDLGNHRITSISVGLYHTALVTASGVALTLGGNEVGQLGHSVAKKSKVGVAKVDFHVRSKNAIVVKQVCCGDLFSLFLTTTGEVYGCGLGNCLGNPHDADVAVADRVEGLLGSNIVAISCGSSHSLALSSNGELYAWGANQHNQLGVEGLVHVQTPTLVPVAKDIGRIVGISCGASHSLAWTDTGKLIGTGSNKYGQLGGIVLPRVTQFTVLETFGSSSGRCIQVSCGKTHSLVLFDEIIVENDYLHVQEVWASGSNSNQQVDTLSTSSMIRQPISLTSFQNNWDIRRVAYIAAGGDQSFVVAITEGTERPDSMLQKRFSTQVSKSIVPMSTIELHYLILEAQRNAMPMFTILNTMGEIFSSSSLLSASFRVPNSVTTDLSVDVIGLEECYGGLMQLGNAAVVKLLSSLQNTLTDLESVVVPTSSTSGEQKQLCHIPDSVIRTLLIVWLCPVNSNAILSSDIMLKLARIICMMPPSLRAKLLDLISVIPLHLVVSRIIKPVQETLSLIVDKADDGNIDPNLPLFCILLNWLYSLPTLKDAVPVDEWYNKSISKLSDELLLRDFLGWKDFHFKKVSGQEQLKQKPFFFANHPFILSVDAKKRILIAESRLQQLNAQQQAFMRGGVMQGGRMYIQPWLILTVQRENLLQSTLAGIESCVEGDLKKPLKVIFEAEEGIDEGGVAKEFFQLLVAQLFAVQYGMFTPTSDGRALWINRASVWNSEQEFHLVGVLLGLAVYNGVLLDIHVPKVFYRKLLIRSPTLADLASVDPGEYDLLSII